MSNIIHVSLLFYYSCISSTFDSIVFSVSSDSSVLMHGATLHFEKRYCPVTKCVQIWQQGLLTKRQNAYVSGGSEMC